MDIEFNELTAGVMIKLKDDIKSSDVLDKDKGSLEDISKTCFKKIDEGFIDRINLNQGGFIVCGDNFIKDKENRNIAEVFSYLGIKGILAKSLDEKQKEDLLKNKIIPMTFIDSKEYDEVGLYDILKVKNLLEDLSKKILEVVNITKGDSFFVKLEL